MSSGHWWHPEVRLLNTATNAAYPVAGVAVALHAPTPAAWAFAATMAALGLGSGLYHWRGTAASRALDWAGMFLVLAGLAAGASAPDFPGLWWALLVSAAVVSLALTYLFRRVGDDWALGVILALSLVPPLAGAPHGRTLALVSLACFASAKIAHSADNSRAAWVGRWGHAYWHVATAAAFGLVYLAGAA